MKRKLYNLPVRDEWIIRLGTQSQRNTAAISPVSEGDESVAKTVSLQPGEIPFEFLVPGDRSETIAQSFKELLNSSYEQIPLFTVGDKNDLDGYYTPSRGDARPVDALGEGSVHRVNAVLKEAGKAASRFRAIETQPNPLVNQVTTDSTQSFTRVAAPAAASNVHWYDAVSGAVFDAVPVDSTPVQTEFGGVDLFDPSAAFTTDRPTLTYDVDYADQGKTDVRVWDTNGNINRADSDGNVQWSRVFSSSHDFRGVPVVSNGAVRVFGRVTTHVDADTWDNANSTWSFATGPDAAPWELQEIDLRKLSPVGVDMRWRFRNTSTGQTHALAATLKRGRDVLHFENPDPGAQTTTPDPIRSMLNPIASRQTKIADPALGLIEKSKIEP